MFPYIARILVSLYAHWASVCTPLWEGGLSAVPRSSTKMLGWLLTFALLALCGFLFSFSGGTGGELLAPKVAAAVFGALFFVCLLTRFVRRRA